jgi:hypothetical protein
MGIFYYYYYLLPVDMLQNVFAVYTIFFHICTPMLKALLQDVYRKLVDFVFQPLTDIALFTLQAYL